MTAAASWEFSAKSAFCVFLIVFSKLGTTEFTTPIICRGWFYLMQDINRPTILNLWIYMDRWSSWSDRFRPFNATYKVQTANYLLGSTRLYISAEHRGWNGAFSIISDRWSIKGPNPLSLQLHLFPVQSHLVSHKSCALPQDRLLFLCSVYTSYTMSLFGNSLFLESQCFN